MESKARQFSEQLLILSIKMGIGILELWLGGEGNQRAEYD